MTGALLILLGPGVSCSAPQPEAVAGSGPVAAFTVDSLPEDVAPLYLQLTDAAAPAEQRQSAATALLLMQRPEADRALAAALSPQAGLALWQPVLAALGTSPRQPAAPLTDAMIELLAIADGAVRHDLALALGRHLVQDEPRLERVVTLARGSEQPAAVRQSAVLALAHCRTQRVARVLVDLTDEEQPDRVRQAAFAALANLTGLDRPGASSAEWQQWWQQARQLSPEAWRDQLVENFARRDEFRRQQQQQIEQRLAESQRALYRAASPDERPTLLARMLNDPLESVRLLALDLSVQRLLDDGGFDEPLRQALRSRLDDASPELRQRATLLLRDLADEPAADRVAQRLAEGLESSTTVLRADLLLVSRLPRREAVPAALEFLVHPSLRAEAAGALAAAQEAGVLHPRQAARALKRVRADLDGASPAPQVVMLLARLGEDEDWARIARWLQSEDQAVKQAAARAWADSDQPLAPMAALAHDPIIRPLLVLAAGQRGRDGKTLEALAAHPPQDANGRENWQRALIALSARVPERTVLTTVRSLMSREQPARLGEQMLTAALDRESTGSTGQPVADLLLERARLRLMQGDAAQAVADYERVASLKGRLNARQAVDAGRGRIRGYLLLNETDRAFTVAREAFEVADLVAEAAGSTVDFASPAYGVNGAAAAHAGDLGVVDLFLAAARRHADADRKAEARQILTQLRQWLAPAMQVVVAERIALLEAYMAGATTPATEPPPTAVPPAASEPVPADPSTTDPPAQAAARETKALR